MGHLQLDWTIRSRMKILAQFSSSSSSLLKRNTSSSTRNKRAAGREVNHNGVNHKEEGNIVLCLGSEIPQVMISFSEKGDISGEMTHLREESNTNKGKLDPVSLRPSSRMAE